VLVVSNSAQPSPKADAFLKPTEPRPGRQKRFLRQIISLRPASAGPAKKGPDRLLVAIYQACERSRGSCPGGCDQRVIARPTLSVHRRGGKVLEKIAAIRLPTATQDMMIATN
jgi:hypothetical protein